MRHAAILLAYCTLAAHAQNWALLNPAYRYNYSNDGTDTISNQIRVMQVDTLGPDSFRYELNSVTELCDTCQGPQVFLRTNRAQFLQRSVLAGTTTWHFSDPGSFTILPHSGVGTSWLFDTLANVQATVTVIDTVVQFGTSVPRKTIQLSNGNEIQLSETYGILSWIGHSLIGVHGADVGSLIPPVSAFYPYQAGDVIQYRTDYNNCWPCNGHDSQFKITIAQAVDQDSAIAINGWLTGYTHHYQEFGFGNYSHWYTYVDEPTTWTAGSGTLPFFDLIGSYPGQLMGPVLSTGAFWSGLLCIARHGIDTNGRYIIRCEQIPGVGYFTQPISVMSGPLIEVQPQFEFCSDAWPPCGVEYRDGTGLVQYGGSFFETQESYVLDGTVVAGDTTGTVLTNDQLLVVHEAVRTTSYAISPNPANDIITVEGVRTGEAITILDATGRSVLTRNATSTREGIAIDHLPAGVYLLRCGNARVPHRFLIAR